MTVRLDFAPLDGITKRVFRRVWNEHFGGADRCFIPFISPTDQHVLTPRDRRELESGGLPHVPQIMAKRAADFVWAAETLADMGFPEVNLNLGCPSGTVTARKRGAGFLSDPDALDAFLYEIYEKCPLKISVKTRLGVSDLEEWTSLLDIYARYPIQELIIHTRLLQEFYIGSTHPEAYAEAMEKLRPAGIPLCYNGDIVSIDSLLETYKRISAVSRISERDGINDDSDRIMIGRGLLRNPALAKQLKESGQVGKDGSAAAQPALETFRAFHDEILEGYCQIMSGDLPVLFKMKDLWTYMISAFAEYDSANSGPDGLYSPYAAANPAAALSDRKDLNKYLKKIRKADHISEYKTAVDSLFREYGVPAAISFA